MKSINVLGTRAGAHKRREPPGLAPPAGEDDAVEDGIDMAQLGSLRQQKREQNDSRSDGQKRHLQGEERERWDLVGVTGGTCAPQAELQEERGQALGAPCDENITRGASVREEA